MGVTLTPVVVNAPAPELVGKGIKAGYPLYVVQPVARTARIKMKGFTAHHPSRC
jgi:hypothetical protein